MPSRFAQRGGWWVCGQMFLLSLLIISGLCFHNQWQGLLTVVAGIALMVVSALFGIGGVLALGRHLTPFPHPSIETRLVQDGVYRFVRHPLYTAVISFGLGWALVWRSWPALAVAALLAVFLWAKARVEERALTHLFPEYPDYQRRVHAFIPLKRGR